jgi:alpha-tubulin suppressor-like RCC1 family protein
VPEFKKKPLKQISCGQFHSLVLTQENELYTWGYGIYGRLGNGKSDTKGNPIRISLYQAGNQLNTSQNESNWLHSQSGGDVSLGSGDFMRVPEKQRQTLGFSSSNQDGTLDLHPALEDIVKVVAGDAHNFVLTATGKLYAFGYNNRG